MLKIKNLCKRYRTESVETYALNEIDVNIAEGEFVSVTGPSGSGKTTFLSIAGLLESFESGEYSLDGEDVHSLSDIQMSKIRNEKIGFIFQGFNLMPDLNIFHNVEVPLQYRGMSAQERKVKVEKALEIVGLSSRLTHYPSQLSGGQQQRVAIARAIVGEPKIILADEPTGNLDSVMALQIMELLESINAAGTTIVMVTHENELAKRAHRNIRILDGEIVVAQPKLAEAANQ